MTKGKEKVGHGKKVCISSGVVWVVVSGFEAFKNVRQTIYYYP